MQNDNKLLDNVMSVILIDENVGKALRMLRLFVNEHPYINVDAQLNAIEEDYGLMKSFMLRSFKDTKRADVYNGLLNKLFMVTCGIKIKAKVENSMAMSAVYVNSLKFNPQQDGIRTNLEGFVQDVAMLSLEPDVSITNKKKALYEKHQEYVNSLFDSILVSSPWNDDTATFYGHLLSSPMIDAADAQLIVSAVMLAAMNFYDLNKIIALIDIYVNSDNEHVRQRALIGWLFALPDMDSKMFGKLRGKIHDICEDKTVRREILEAQMQVFYCLNAERDNAEIQRSIIPNLIKNNNLKFTEFGVKEIEEDQMQDILDPGAADKAMSEVEESFGKMLNMQKAGADIYFGSFSKMKRYPFFNKLSNWFCPFYPEHPELQAIKANVRDSKFMQMLYNNGPFCDSDKYSFALTISSIIDQLPASMREMIGNEDIMGPMPSDMDKDGSAYIRRMYLQDLYRFFKVYPYRIEFKNAFDCKYPDYSALFFINGMFDKTQLQEEARELERFLIKRKHYNMAEKTYVYYSVCDNVDDLMVKAALSMHFRRYTDAQATYERVLSMEPENMRAVKGMANSSFYCSDYDEASANYQRLLDRQPDNRIFALNLCISQIKKGSVEDGIKGLFKLNFEYPDDNNIKRALGWGHMSAQKPQLAEKIYDDLLALHKHEDADFLNAGYCKWFVGKVSEAAELFKKYLSLFNSHCGNIITISEEIDNDRPLLDINGISDVEIKIMVDIVDD